MRGYKKMGAITTVLVALWVTDGIFYQAFAKAVKTNESKVLSTKTTSSTQVSKSSTENKATFKVSKPAVKSSKKHRRIAKVKQSNNSKSAEKHLKLKKGGKKVLIPAVKTATVIQAPEGRSIALKARERALARIKKPLLLSKHTSMMATKTTPKTLGAQTDIHLPDAIKDPRLDPRFDWLRHQFSRQQQMDRWLKSPAHDMIDPGTTGMPGPDRKPPHTSQGWYRYRDQNDESDLAHPDNVWRLQLCDRATRQKVLNTLIGPGRSEADMTEGFPVPEEKGGEKENDDSVVNDKPTDEKTTEEGIDPEASDIVEEDPEDTQDANRDTDPEGDDPDEIRNALLAEAAITTGVGQGSRSNGGDTSIQRSTEENGGGLGQIWWENTGGGGSPLPEDGRPDESASPSASSQISHSMAGGVAHYPAPGDEAPDDPRAGDGIMTTMNSGAVASSPVDGGQGDEPLPPTPEPK